MRNTEILISNGVNLASSLELFGELSLYDETMQDYLNGVDKKVADIKRFKEVGDMPDYAILVHSLKSDAKYLGFTRLAEIAYNHEMQSKDNNLYYVTEHFDELINECTRITNVAKEYMNTGISATSEEQTNEVVKEKTILVVDDSTIIRNFIEKIFDKTFNVINASDGAEAINIIAMNQHSIIGVLLDLNMPNVDGFAVLEYFKENNLFSKMAVSIITGEDTKEAITKAFTYPIVDVLTKPFNERDIKRIVDKTIEFNTNR
ncbi:MAG: response regulator [Bacilli bacterium]